MMNHFGVGLVVGIFLGAGRRAGREASFPILGSRGQESANQHARYLSHTIEQGATDKPAEYAYWYADKAASKHQRIKHRTVDHYKERDENAIGRDTTCNEDAIDKQIEQVDQGQQC